MSFVLIDFFICFYLMHLNIKNALHHESIIIYDLRNRGKCTHNTDINIDSRFRP